VAARSGDVGSTALVRIEQANVSEREAHESSQQHESWQ